MKSASVMPRSYFRLTYSEANGGGNESSSRDAWQTEGGLKFLTFYDVFCTLHLGVKEDFSSPE